MNENQSNRRPAAPKRTALIISFAMFASSGIAVFLITTFVPTDDSAASDPPVLASVPVAPATLSAGLAMVLCLVSVGLARRMYDVSGDVETRTKRALSMHIASAALAEAAVFIGVAFVVATRSWTHAIAMALGGALLVVGMVRAAFIFGRLEEQAGGRG